MGHVGSEERWSEQFEVDHEDPLDPTPEVMEIIERFNETETLRYGDKAKLRYLIGCVFAEETKKGKEVMKLLVNIDGVEHEVKSKVEILCRELDDFGDGSFQISLTPFSQKIEYETLDPDLERVDSTDETISDIVDATGMDKYEPEEEEEDDEMDETDEAEEEEEG